jgi:hypothetical protein
MAPTRRLQIAAGFLAVSYAIGAPLTAWAELGGAVISQRFDLPPALIYLTCAIQLACAAAVLYRPLAPWAAAALTVITLGAIVSHLRMLSGLTALPALVYTSIQVWFGLASRASGSIAVEEVDEDGQAGRTSGGA